ncbi:neuroligin-4, Y-linked-like isoform X2 [Macrosteles quadrilineatus]|uniref:neuroligin-4, Y-linked-like isoform X2 n=1 Tax=Macrosteles quadrilineatus TaxID=74068 RepID=UPI0023E2A11B|nr:neuroligin-4, Y-linked-like isoform X2 [Macrosteles quadrilineatus]
MGRRCHVTTHSHAHAHTVSAKRLCLLFCNNAVLLLYVLSLGEPKTLTRVVQTKYGKLQGFLRPLPSPLKPIEVFLGVPYATPPVGVNRFSPTRTPGPWSGVRLADNFSPVCPQHLPRLDNETLENMPRQRLEMIRRLFPLLKNYSEDCLYLNVYAPMQEGSVQARLPVLVFIHGGSYLWNSGNIYDAGVLASYSQVVVVTINYRLGVLGFLNANMAPYSSARVANYGLMDQVAALHWVQQNIAAFGGDPDNVTLLGHGTGAACIQFLIMSPTVMPGLFHRAVLLSGSALSSWSLVEDPVYWAVRLARQLDCPVPDDLLADHETIVDCLREVPLAKLMKADIQSPAHLSSFGPSVDGVVIKHNFRKEMLTVSGYNPSSDSPFNSYDLLLGVVSNEVLSRFSLKDLRAGFDVQRRDKILRTYIRNAYNYHLSEIYYSVVNEYTDWDRSVDPLAVLGATVSALGDALYNAPLVQTGDMLSTPPLPSGQLSPTRARTFFFVFDYQTKDEDNSQISGAMHGEELPYIFGAPLINSLKPFRGNFSSYQVALSESLMLFFGNFVRSGDPNEYEDNNAFLAVSKERNRYRALVWEEYDIAHQKYLEIGLRTRVKSHYRAHQLSLWLRLIPELHRAGAQSSNPNHNQLQHHEDAQLYEGIVRPDQLFTPVSITTTTLEDLPQTTEATSTCVSVETPVQPPNTSEPLNVEFGYEAYSTALTVTIAIGCSLLVLNILIFAKVYHKKDTKKPLEENKLSSASVIVDMERDSVFSSGSLEKTPSQHSLHKCHHTVLPHMNSLPLNPPNGSVHRYLPPAESTPLLPLPLAQSTGSFKVPSAAINEMRV